MVLVFVALIIVLAVMLYRMLGPSEKTYAYTRTVTVRNLPDGKQELLEQSEAGIVFINKNIVTIDGEDFLLKATGDDERNAHLIYEGAQIKGISIMMVEGEKRFFIDRLAGVPNLSK